MWERKDQITKAIKKYDRELYCDWSPQGPLVIYRKGHRYEPMEVNGVIIHYQIPSPHYVFALTDTWVITGKSIEWGIEPILARLKAMDLWRDDDIIKEHTRNYHKGEESKARDQRNSIESFLYEFRSQFAKATNNVNTSLLDKRKDRRFKDDLKIKEY